MSSRVCTVIPCEVADVKVRQQLRSASSSSMIVDHARLTVIGDPTFPVGDAHIWNNLSQHVASAISMLVSTLIFLPFSIPVHYLVQCLHSDTCHFEVFVLLTSTCALIYVFVYLDSICNLVFFDLVYGCMLYVDNRDAEIKEEVRKSREDRSPKGGRPCHRNGKVDQENSQRIPVIRYGELIVLGYVQCLQ